MIMWCSSTDLTNVKHPRSGLLYTLCCVRWPPNQVYLIGERSSAIFKAHGITYPETGDVRFGQNQSLVL